MTLRLQTDLQLYPVDILLHKEITLSEPFAQIYIGSFRK